MRGEVWVQETDEDGEPVVSPHARGSLGQRGQVEEALAG